MAPGAGRAPGVPGERLDLTVQLLGGQQLAAADLTGHVNWSGGGGDDAGDELESEGLVAQYGFEGDALDELGGLDGVFVGAPTYSQDAAIGAKSLELSGDGQAVSIGTLDVVGEGLTLSAWIKADDFSTSDARVISKATGTAEQQHVFMLSERMGALRLRVRAQGKTDTVVGGEIPIGSWTHVAGTYESQTGAMRLYIDGEEQKSKLHQLGGPVTSSPDVDVWLGGNPDGSEFLQGLLDDVRIHDRALSPSELATLATLPE